MYNIAIVGASGLVGGTFLKVLEERDLPIKNLYLFASARSAGKEVIFKGKTLVIEELTENSFDREIDIALFSAGGDISKKFAPVASEKGVIVVDNSSAWRMDENVPLVVPEVNPEDIFKNNGIIANPNCSTIQSVVPLKVIDELYGIKRVVYSTYQAVSGSGIKGIEDLQRGLKGEEPKTYPHPIVNNCLPHIDSFLENGYTKEEEKMINETRKILNKKNLPITATCVRVPVLNGHSISINVELEREANLEELKAKFRETKGIVLEDDVKNNRYPLATEANGTDEVYVGRLRKDFSIEKGLNLWVVADNIRKGAATNAVQIAEILMKK
ncbi:aspartate-semialdehyde dehydrogenase [Cetobacterium somerae]|uniref:Aspartate-semialdehyde dehydrogenase n=1 Tax=Cetobacterium somerae ATCC BAA-474 TaxID=1319815 RepID=U7V466_9FUSO|nr:aspartate-semialdehyde dehydrogenase [Cetobacterium somerae]ERT66296.1 aspartate-semialdehyde dehydrogenase [Cetobacterium somerae ATCC BAA-474]MCQ9625858.1 aspartate-semialdehyde dehydrogenase [Cetobacterium somerae]WVJ01508.1 aspartate-semialdehyde dehydrogenase [Cetobacterium somerae]